MSALQNSNCQRCSLFRGAKHVCIPGDGPDDADVLFIGEAPGADEDKRGVPFIGQSGKVLRREIERVGLSNVRITNLVRCRPPGNRAPTHEEIKACRPYLDAELELVKPKYVVTLGAPSSKAILRKSKITQDHGQLVPKDNFIGMPIFHPAYILRDPSKLPAMQRDLERLAREVKDEQVDQSIEWELLTRDNFDQFVAEFEAAPRFAFDTETSGLFMHDPKGRIRSLQIALDVRTWVIRLYMPDTPMPKHETQYNFLHWLEAAARGKWAAAANGKFDNNWLTRQYGISFHLDFDTGLAHHVIDENSPHGLKELSRGYLDAPDYDIPLREKLEAPSLPPDRRQVFYEYGARDPHNTLKLAIKFDAMFKKDKNLRRLFYKLVMPAARALQSVELVGITLDMAKRDQMEIEVRKKIEQCLAELNAMTAKEGVSDINWDSPQQVAKFLYGTLKIEPTVLTDGGNPSTGEEALLDIRDQHPIANKLVEYREVAKFMSTYLEGWKEYTYDGRVYFSTKIHGTVTGRWSSRLHQTPRDGIIRNLVTAPPDYTFVQADLSQAELRTVAEVSQDAEMIRCFREKIDIHWKTLMFTILSGGSGNYYEAALKTAGDLRGKKVYDLDRACEFLLKYGHEAAIKAWKGWKEGRKSAKGINFGYVYGMGATKFVEYARMKYGFEPTMQESENIREAFFTLYRGLEPWHKRQRSLVRLNGEVRNLIGRVRRLPGANSTDRMLRGEAERQAINSPIQGVIGDLKAMALIEIHETCPPWSVRIVGEVHDSILMNVRTEELDIWLPKIRAIMRHPKLLDEFGVKLSVPLDADLEVGNWGAGTTYRKDLE